MTRQLGPEYSPIYEKVQDSKQNNPALFPPTATSAVTYCFLQSRLLLEITF